MIIELECVECGFCSANNEEVEECERDLEDNYICPFCGEILIINNIKED